MSARTFPDNRSDEEINAEIVKTLDECQHIDTLCKSDPILAKRIEELTFTIDHWHKQHNEWFYERRRLEAELAETKEKLAQATA